MQVHGFTIPDALCKLIDLKIWPEANTAWGDINLQSFHPVLGPEAAHALSPNDDRIVMMPPPFHTIADEVAAGNSFWLDSVKNPHEIDYIRAVIIADFGLGSDSPIILYYDGAPAPEVRYLKWSGDGRHITHSWEKTHDSFEEFASAIGLMKLDP